MGSKEEYRKHRESYLRRSEAYRKSTHGKEVIRKWWQGLKKEVLTYYGADLHEPMCTKCGFTDIRALSIDHMEGDGAKHHRTTGRYGSKIYQWLKQQGFPPGYQTLCMNCQWVKRTEEKEHR